MFTERPHITPSEFQALLDRHARIALTGMVKSGKSLLLDETEYDRFRFHTDSLGPSGERWEDYPRAVLDAVSGLDAFLLTGMQVPRILRKGLEVDCLLWLNRPLHPLTRKQLAFSRGARTIMHKWRKTRPEVDVHFCHTVKREEAHDFHEVQEDEGEKEASAPPTEGGDS